MRTFFGILSVLFILAMWVEHGFWIGLVVVVGVGLLWGVCEGATGALAGWREGVAEVEAKQREDEAARKAAREELLRK